MLVLDGGEEMVIHAMRERDAAAPAGVHGRR